MGTATVVKFPKDNLTLAATELATLNLQATDKVVFWRSGSSVVVVRVGT